MSKMAAFVATLGFLAALPASAQTVSQNWEAHRQGDSCYSISFPQSSKGAAGDRGSYVAVRNDLGEKVWDSVSVVSGFKDVSGAKVTARVDNGQPRQLLPYRGAAFIKSGAPEQDLIGAMRRGKTLTVTWRLADGRTVTDTFSLLGFTATHKDIGGLCGRR